MAGISGITSITLVKLSKRFFTFLTMVMYLCCGALTSLAVPQTNIQQPDQPPNHAADQQHQHHHSTSPESTPEEKRSVKPLIPDVEVLDERGRRIRFHRDLVQGKVVAINFIFTTCTAICPSLGATFAKVQNLMGDQVGKVAHLISISTDPITDTPERLRVWGAKFGAKPGWTFVTGEKKEMDKLLLALTGDPARVGKRMHSPVVLIGNDTTGTWTRAYGLAQPTRLVKLINDMGHASTTALPTEKFKP